MRRSAPLGLLLLTCASLCASNSARAEVSVTLTVASDPQPQHEGRPLVSQTASLRYTVTSTYQLTSIVAKVGESSTPLPLGSSSALLAVDALTRGVHTITVEATEAFGGKGTASVEVFHDNPPTLTVVEPLPNQVVRDSTFQVRVVCEDDDPEGCKSIALSGAGFATPASGSGAMIEATAQVDATWANGALGTVKVVASDSLGAVATTSIPLWSERSKNLELLANGAGTILDFDAQRLLVKTGSQLQIRDRKGGVTRELSTRAGAGSAVLTRTGATWLEGPEGAPRALWQLLGDAAKSIATTTRALMDGSAAAWLVASEGGAPAIARLDLEAGTTRSGQPWASVNPDGIQAPVLTPGGDVVGVVLGADGAARLVRDRNGVVSDLGPVPGVPTQLWASDRAVVSAFGREKGIWALDFAAGATLQNLGDQSVNGGAAAGDWLAYSAAATNEVRGVWRRTPDGKLERATFFLANTDVHALAPTGQLVVMVDAQIPSGGDPEAGMAGQRGRYFVSEKPVVPQWLISHSEGRVVVRCDGWCLLLGGGLLRFTQDDLQEPFPCPAPEPTGDAGVEEPDGDSDEPETDEPTAPDAGVEEPEKLPKFDPGSCAVPSGQRSASAGLVTLLAAVLLLRRRRKQG